MTSQTFAELQAEIEALVTAGAGVEAPRDDERFNDLALRVFHAQFAHNEEYRQLCLAQGGTPQSVTRWEEIPAVPAAALPAHRAPAASAFVTSALLALIDTYLFPDDARMPIVSLPGPPAEQQPTLNQIIALAINAYGTSAGSAGQVDKDEFSTLVDALRAAEHDRQPVCLIGQAARYSGFLDYCTAANLTFQLPAGSRLLDTVGPGGAASQTPRDELYTGYRERLGLPPTACISVYAPPGVAACFIDNILYDAYRREWRPRHKVIPPWVRTQIVDAKTHQPVTRGSPGLLRHVDLTNLHTVAAVQTQDVAVVVAYGFEVIAHAGGAAV